MKEETKRYTLIEYLGPQVRFLNSYKKYLELLETLKKYNRNSKEKYYFGNAYCEKITNNMYKVVIYVYNKLTKKMSITNIDDITSLKSEQEVIDLFKDKIKTNKIFKPDIQIMYFEEKNKKDKKPDDCDIRIKYIPVLYKRDTRFLDKEYVKKCIHYEARENENTNFFKKMANEFCLYHSITDKVEKLRHYIDLCEKGDGYFADLEHSAIDLYEAFILERDSDKKLYRDENGKCAYSRRRIRDFGFFIRDYMLPQYKKVSPTNYNQTVTASQMEEFKNEQLRKEEEKLKREEERHETKKLQLSLYDYLKD